MFSADGMSVGKRLEFDDGTGGVGCCVGGAECASHVGVSFELGFACGRAGVEERGECFGSCVRGTIVQQEFGDDLASDNEIWERHVLYIEDCTHYIVGYFRAVGTI